MAGLDQFFSSARAVIFDLDGTLYDQRKLRQRMLFEMLCWCLKHPSSVRDIMVLADFRKAREEHSFHADAGIERLQFEWGAKRSNVSVERVRRVVSDWIFQRPLKHMPDCRFPGVRDFFSVLMHRGILIGVFSDYPAGEKLNALRLEAHVLVSATDYDVDRLKPDPKGLLVTAAKLRTPIRECLFIGDRDDKDGECARRAGMPYLIMNRKRSHSNGFGSFSEITEWF
jgi:FMN phosphatase YigB (HAD superfamily)